MGKRWLLTTVLACILTLRHQADARSLTSFHIERDSLFDASKDDDAVKIGSVDVELGVEPRPTPGDNGEPETDRNDLAEAAKTLNPSTLTIATLLEESFEEDGMYGTVESGDRSNELRHDSNLESSETNQIALVRKPRCADCRYRNSRRRRNDDDDDDDDDDYVRYWRRRLGRRHRGRGFGRGHGRRWRDRGGDRNRPDRLGMSRRIADRDSEGNSTIGPDAVDRPYGYPDSRYGINGRHRSRGPRLHRRHRNWRRYRHGDRSWGVDHGNEGRHHRRHGVPDNSRDRDNDGNRDNSRDRDNDGNRDNSRDRDNDGNRDNSRDRDNDGNRDNSRDRDNDGNRDNSRDRDNDGNRDNSRDRDNDDNRDRDMDGHRNRYGRGRRRPYHRRERYPNGAFEHRRDDRLKQRPYGPNEHHFFGENGQHPHGPNGPHPFGENGHPFGTNEHHPFGEDGHPYDTIRQHPFETNGQFPFDRNEYPFGRNEHSHSNFDRHHPVRTDEDNPFGTVDHGRHPNERPTILILE